MRCPSIDQAGAACADPAVGGCGARYGAERPLFDAAAHRCVGPTAVAATAAPPSEPTRTATASLTEPLPFFAPTVPPWMRLANATAQLAAASAGSNATANGTVPRQPGSRDTTEGRAVAGGTLLSIDVLWGGVLLCAAAGHCVRRRSAADASPARKDGSGADEPTWPPFGSYGSRQPSGALAVMPRDASAGTDRRLYDHHPEKPFVVAASPSPRRLPSRRSRTPLPDTTAADPNLVRSPRWSRATGRRFLHEGTASTAPRSNADDLSEWGDQWQWGDPPQHHAAVMPPSPGLGRIDDVDDDDDRYNPVTIG
jgi:hypothetical protein